MAAIPGPELMAPERPRIPWQNLLQAPPAPAEGQTWKIGTLSHKREKATQAGFYADF